MRDFQNNNIIHDVCTVISRDTKWDFGGAGRDEKDDRFSEQ